jgi:hypothetical protein
MSEENVEIVRNAFAAFDRATSKASCGSATKTSSSPSRPSCLAFLVSNMGTAGSWKPLRSGQSSGMTIESSS